MDYIKLKDCSSYRKERTTKFNLENYITTENMLSDKGGVIVAESLPDCKTLPKYEVNDILLSNIRPYFKKIWHSNREGGCSNDVLVLKVNNEHNSKFIYYVLSDNNFFNYATVTSKGTKMPRGTPNAIMNYLVPNISIEIENKIVNILSTYDDLIENNNKRIKILEQTAENLYKEWFVRFRFPGYENAEFENGIPKGWTIKRMQEFCYVTDGTHNSPKSVDIGIPLITGKYISNGFIDFNISYNISSSEHESIKKRSGLKSGDIIFSNIGTVGNCCIIDYDREFSVKNVIIFKPKTMVETSYLYYWLTSSIMQEIFSTQTNGASQQFVGLNFMRRYKLFVPSNDVLENFAKKIVPIINQKKLLHKINLKLIEQRDLLLPRLMSGKLEVE